MNASLFLALADALICAVIALRLMSFQRGAATYRPLVSLLAYLVTVSAMAVVIFTLFSAQPGPGWHEVLLHAVLCMAVLSARGNLMELFRTSDGDGWLVRILRRGSAQ